MKLEEHVKDAIKKHALREKPNECCGLLVSNEGKTLVFESNNKSTKPEHHFLISPLDYIQASRRGKIFAAYHSHLKGCEFSEADKFNSKSHEIIYVLYCLENNSIIQYDPSLDFYSYVGRRFEWTTSDCFTLVRDFYKRELNIDIANDPPRDEDWKKQYEGIFDKFFQKENFKEVKNLKKYDGILFKTKKEGFSTHCGIYLGEGLFLHQPRGTVSRIDEYNDRYKNITNKIVRHESL